MRMDTVKTPAPKATQAVEKPTSTGGRVFRGVVISAKMQDTATVAVERYVKHPKYKKYIRRTKKYLVHDKGNTAAVGDKVEIRETKPMSKRKHFSILSVSSRTDTDA